MSGHYDHTSGQTIKGMNFITALYHVQGVSLPVNHHRLAKTAMVIDPKTGKQKRRANLTKNEVCQLLLRQTVANQIPFGYVVNDVWYASADNMKVVKHDLKHSFVMPIKTNRKVTVSVEMKRQGRYVRVAELGLEAGTTMTAYLEGVDFPLRLVKQVVTNADGSVGTFYLVTSDLELTCGEITTIHTKRGNVEPYHKSLKQNASLSLSPTKTVTTQSNHLFASLYAYIKLGLLKVSTKLNHFAIKSQLYLRALQVAFATLLQAHSVRLAA